MNLTETRKGEFYILAESLINSLFPVISLISFATLPPLFSLSYSWVFTALFFLFVIAYRNKFSELADLELLKDLIWVVLFIGILYYGLYFFALRYTTANNAGIIIQMELFFTFLFFNVWKKEALTTEHLLGAGLMLFSTLLIFFPQIRHLDFNKGDLLILLCTAFPPVGNFFQRKMRRKASSESVMFLRTIFSLPFVFLLAFVLSGNETQSVDLKTILFLLFNGIIILGISKIFWLEAILRISVTKANALASIKPVLTILFSFLMLGNLPNLWQLSSIPPMLLGVYMLTRPSPEIYS